MGARKQGTTAIGGRQRWVEIFGRIGYSAKGIVYGLIGILAVNAAFGGGGKTTGARGAIRELASQPFGLILLVATAIGLVAYGAWRLLAAVLDTESTGEGKEGAAKRVAYAASGIIYLSLAYFSARLALGSGGGGSGQQAMTAKVMSAPLGVLLIGLIGGILVGVGAYHFKRAYKCSFMRKYRGEMSPRQRSWARRIGRWGLSARGVTFALIGVFFIQAAVTANPDQAQGLGAAFNTLLQQPYGPWLLAVVAAGFVCYGIYCFSYARYRQF